MAATTMTSREFNHDTGRAMVHNLVVLSRSISDFEATGARVLNPWEGAFSQ